MTTPSFRIRAFGALLIERLSPGSTILEIGCGSGELATLLADAGHDVTAIDRKPRPEFPIPPQDFETYDSRGAAFDCVAAMLVLHHVDDLNATVAKMASLVAPRGFLAIDDYGWERRETSSPEAVAWREERSGLHTSVAMLAALDGAFRRDLYRDHAYFDEGLGTDRLGFTYLGTPESPGSSRSEGLSSSRTISNRSSSRA